MSVLLINQGWTDNLGDIAIGEVMERELAEFSPITVEFAPIVMKKTKGVLPKILWLYYLDNKYREWIDAKLNTIGNHISGAIIGGGELFASNSNFNAAVKIWVEQLGKRNIPIYIFGVGGGYTNTLYRIRYRNALKKVNGVYVRDPYSKTVFEKSYCVSAKCFADVVFTYGNKKIFHKKINTILCNILSYEQYINGKGEKTKEEYFADWKKLIESEIDNNTILLYGSTTKEDRQTTEEFAEIYGRPYSIVFTDTIEEYWNLLDTVGCVISGRMHSMILAMQKGCRCVPYMWKDKLCVFSEQYCNCNMDVNAIRADAFCGFEELKNNLVTIENK